MIGKNLAAQISGESRCSQDFKTIQECYRGFGPQRGISVSVWEALRTFAYCALTITDHLAILNGGEALAICVRITEKFDKPRLAAIGQAVSDVIDFEESRLKRKTVVRQGVNGDLDEIRRTYDGIDDLLSRAAEHIALRVPATLVDQLNVVYFPQIGFLIACGLDEETGDSMFDGPTDNPWERVFATAEAVYYKNTDVRQMDDHYGDVYGQICDREIELAQELAERVLEYEKLRIIGIRAQQIRSDC